MRRGYLTPNEHLALRALIVALGALLEESVAT
jgi:hypothetical protein